MKLGVTPKATFKTGSVPRPDCTSISVAGVSVDKWLILVQKLEERSRFSSEVGYPDAVVADHAKELVDVANCA